MTQQVGLPLDSPHMVETPDLGSHAPKHTKVILPPSFAGSYSDFHKRKPSEHDEWEKGLDRSNAFLSVDNPEGEFYANIGITDLPVSAVLNRSDIMSHKHSPVSTLSETTVSSSKRKRETIAERRARKFHRSVSPMDHARQTSSETTMTLLSDSSNADSAPVIPAQIQVVQKTREPGRHKREKTPPPLPIVFDATRHVPVPPGEIHTVQDADLPYKYLVLNTSSTTGITVSQPLRVHCSKCERLSLTLVNATLSTRGIITGGGLLLVAAPIMIPALLASSLVDKNKAKDRITGILGKGGYEWVHRCSTCRRVLLVVANAIWDPQSAEQS
jgi:hypothetical protein